MGSIRSFAAVALAIAALAGGHAAAADPMSTPFAGKAVNGGTVTVSQQDGKTVLTLSRDFVVPGSPDPHWQVIDSRGNAYLLNRLTLKDDKVNTAIALPRYVPDVAKVQMWCAWAEVVLGEASFGTPVAAAK
jgi:hypothetical protein